jgi:hypothetical protein
VYCRGGGVSKEYDTVAEGLGDRIAYGLSWRGDAREEKLDNSEAGEHERVSEYSD